MGAVNLDQPAVLLPGASAPRVSVCIPTYCGAPFIAAAIRSVLEQSFRDFELIVIDDNSTDATCEIVAGISDNRLRMMRSSQNLGAEGNWNRCLDEARGEYIKLLPQDDLLHPDCLKNQVAVFDADRSETLALVFCARFIIDRNDKIFFKRGYPLNLDQRIDRQQLIRSTIRSGANLVGEPGAVLFRRTASQVVGKFDASISYVVDVDYWLRLLAVGDAYYLCNPLASFRVSAISWSVAIGSRQIEQYWQFIDRVARAYPSRLSAVDRISGRVRAIFNTLLRMVFYRLVVPGVNRDP